MSENGTAKVRRRRKKRRLRGWVRTVLLVLMLAVVFFSVRFLLSVFENRPSAVYDTILRVPSDPDQPPVSYAEKENLFFQSDQALKDCLLAVSENSIDFYLIRLDRRGKIIYGWYEKDGRKYYYDPQSGRQYSGLNQIGEEELMFEKTGALADEAWIRTGRDWFWYEDGKRMGTDQDMILFVQGEAGFSYLQADAMGARLANDEIVLADGRIARFDEEGRLRNDEDSETLCFPLPEAEETADKTVLIPAAEYTADLREEPLRYISHRGYHVSAPENSLAAYKESFRMGYRYVECDIQMTADQIPVLLHDPTINQTARQSDGSALPAMVHVGDLSYEELLTYDFGLAAGGEYAGMKITRLDTFLAYCSAVSLHPYLELKMETVDTQEDVDIIVDIVRQQHMENRCSWISFSNDALSYVLNDLPDAEAGWLLNSEETADSYMPQIIALKENGYNVFVDAAHPLAARVSAQCQNHDIPLRLWMVNWPAYLDTMDPYVSGITTDNLLPPYE